MLVGRQAIIRTNDDILYCFIRANQCPCKPLCHLVVTGLLWWYFRQYRSFQFSLWMAPPALKYKKKWLKRSTNLISSEGGQDTSGCTISGHSLHAFSEKCTQTYPDGNTGGRTGSSKNYHGWSDGPTDPYTGGNRVYQASDGRTDGRTTRKHNASGA